ncbi:MAG: hypothetical protein Q4B80_06060 [Aerococcaceae bacterium]|nr:hypothetical protein [Aerococcaceae bacterium]
MKKYYTLSLMCVIAVVGLFYFGRFQGVSHTLVWETQVGNSTQLLNDIVWQVSLEEGQRSFSYVLHDGQASFLEDGLSMVARAETDEVLKLFPIHKRPESSSQRVKLNNQFELWVPFERDKKTLAYTLIDLNNRQFSNHKVALPLEVDSYVTIIDYVVNGQVAELLIAWEDWSETDNGMTQQLAWVRVDLPTGESKLLKHIKDAKFDYNGMGYRDKGVSSHALTTYYYDMEKMTLSITRYFPETLDSKVTEIKLTDELENAQFYTQDDQLYMIERRYETGENRLMRYNESKRSFEKVPELTGTLFFKEDLLYEVRENGEVKIMDLRTDELRYHGKLTTSSKDVESLSLRVDY